jgi:hypothetical protein
VAHRVKQITRNGAHETARIHGAPDADMAAMFVASFGGQVLSADHVEDDASFVHGESNWDDQSLKLSGMANYSEWEASK